jgi:hypothetical protein
MCEDDVSGIHINNVLKPDNFKNGLVGEFILFI